VLREVGENETMHENIQDYLKLGEGHPGFQLVFLEILHKGSTVIFFLIYSYQHILHY
jgi:hypothetical protein